MTTGRINQVAAELYFDETERSANTGDSESRNCVGQRTWAGSLNASSHEFRTCQFYHASRRRLRPTLYDVVLFGRRRRRASLHQRP